MNNMRMIRRQRGLTMKELGKAVGVAESTISLYETGKHEPDLMTLQRIADVLETTVDNLIGREPQEQPPPEQVQEAAAIIAELSPEELKDVLSYAEFVKAKRK